MQHGSRARLYPPPDWVLAVMVFGAALIAYWPALGGAMLWDDPAHITVPELQSWSGLWRILTQFGTVQEYYPVLHGAFWIEHRLWGDTLPAYHLLNIALHAGSACLLALILRRLWQPAGDTKASGSAAIPPGVEWFAAFAFAVHPVAVESVAWITEQKNTLSVFFYLLAALWYLRFAERRHWTDYGLAFGAFVLALGAKTATITLPAALLVIAWWRYGSITWRRDLLPLLPWWALAIAAGLVTVHVETNYVGAKGAAYALGLGQRLLLAPRIVWFYLAKDLWPQDLLFYYPRWNVPVKAPGWWGYAGATLAVTAAFWTIRRRARGPLAGWLLFVGAMFPVIGFFNVFAFVFSYVADHFQYMPCFTLVAAVTSGIAFGMSRLPRRFAGVALLAGVGVIGALVLQSRRLSALYVNNETLFGYVAVHNPAAWMAHEILGTTYAKSNRSEAAIAEYRTVLRLKPDHPDAYLGLALEVEKKPGGRAEALALYAKAIELRPFYAEAHYDYGVALARDPARRAEARKHLEVAAELRPYFAEAQAALGNLLAQDPSALDQALARFQTALRLRPNVAATQRDYADALARARRTTEAIAEYESALRLDPDDAMAHFHLADVLMATGGRMADALPHYETAVRLDPGLAQAQAHLASLLAGMPGHETEALAHAEAAVRASPADPELHNTLGILCAQQGNLQRARREWMTAVELNPQYADARLNLQRLEQMTNRPQ